MADTGAQPVTLLILSDIHHAGPAEQARGADYELAAIRRPLPRWLARAYRHYFWMRDPLARSAQLERFLARAGPADVVVVNGDLSMDSAFIGVADAAARESAAECLRRLAEKFGRPPLVVMGDHELGKRNLFAGAGSMRLASWAAATGPLGIQPFWRLELGRWVLLAVTSSLLALPAHPADLLPGERADWETLRASHLQAIRAAFDRLQTGQRLLLFCHDPTALPFLLAEPAVRRRLPQLEQTIIGHLHTPLIWWKCRLLAGLPPIRRLGPSVHKLSSALHQARDWRPFKARLCPALAGVELLNDGGYLTARLDPAGAGPLRFNWHPLPR